MTVRQAIVRTVDEQPGIHFRALQREVGCSVNTLNHHLHRENTITAKQVRGYRRLYPADLPDTYHDPLAALNHEPRGPILYAVDDRPGITNADLADLTDLAASTLSTHIQILADADLITVSQNGRRKRYDTEHTVSRVITEYASDILEQAADGFIDLWE